MASMIPHRAYQELLLHLGDGIDNDDGFAPRPCIRPIPRVSCIGQHTMTVVKGPPVTQLRVAVDSLSTLTLAWAGNLTQPSAPISLAIKCLLVIGCSYFMNHNGSPRSEAANAMSAYEECIGKPQPVSCRAEDNPSRTNPVGLISAA
ncbi:hypothetical protein CCUS01_04717 [Colletotrichum cuscutae]|uniref:Uncharacterized protein n=1 Tax=Colletotrichum cuscutae TaxID=1209917 RepID=A0AAI9VB02_9PEZI|nr:hypothetical protein CCUS01_04717 [Colletotrichum cuscutae]